MAPTLFQGIAAAAVLGLAVGAGMQPELAFGDDEPTPPVAVFADGEAWTPIGWSGPGPAPDYVIGSDWLRPAYDAPVYDAAVETYSDEPVVIVDEPLGPPPELAQWRFAEAPPRAFPSEGGDILGGVSESTAEHAAEPEPAYPDA